MDTNKAEGIPGTIAIPDREGWVDARSLFKTLKLVRKKDFSRWIKKRINRFRFICGEDFVTRQDKYWFGSVTNYLLSPRMAKKLIEVQWSQNGKEEYVKTFTFNNYKLRVTIRNGKLWFFVLDICKILGLVDAPRRIYKLNDEDRIALPFSDDRVPCGVSYFQLVSEYGLYVIIFRLSVSDKIDVGKWLINEALPEIRKAYAKSPTIRERFFQFIKSFTGGAK